MIRSKLKPPITQRHFANAWGELEYLCKKIRFWLHARKQKARAERYADRLGQVLRDLPENDMAIIHEEGLALLYELEGKLNEAIAHRRREIELMERLHREARSPKYSESARAYMLRDRDLDALHERKTFIETLELAISESNGRDKKSSAIVDESSTCAKGVVDWQRRRG